MFMANGSLTSTLTRTLPPKSIQTYPVSWTESSTPRAPHSSRIANVVETALDIERPSAKAQTVSSTALPNAARASTLRNTQHEPRQFSFVGDSISMRSSPAGSWMGSATHDKTPRIRLADTIPLSSPFQSLSSTTLPTNKTQHTNH
jgi:hypothetical protein